MLKRIIQKIKKGDNKEKVDEVYEFFANGKSKDQSLRPCLANGSKRSNGYLKKS